MTYDYFGVPNHREGVNVQALGEVEALIKGIGFNLVISCDTQIPMTPPAPATPGFPFDAPSK
jgi:hypothetical protein